MKFLLSIHRSIFDLSFYEEVIEYSRKRIVKFLFRIIIISSVILSLCHTWQIINPVNGLPAILPQMFPQMEITPEGMKPNQSTPYVVNPFYIAEFKTLLQQMPVSYFEIPDSFIVVDNKASNSYSTSIAPRIIFAIDAIVMFMNSKAPLIVPYSYITNNRETIIFSFTGIREYLFQVKNVVTLFLALFFVHGSYITFSIVFNILFLFAAAALFRNRKAFEMHKLMKIACFVVTPVALGIIFNSFQKIRFSMMWHITIVISVSLLLRILYSSTSGKSILDKKIGD